jgi:hypothetical protein
VLLTPGCTVCLKLPASHNAVGCCIVALDSLPHSTGLSVSPLSPTNTLKLTPLYPWYHGHPPAAALPSPAFHPPPTLAHPHSMLNTQVAPVLRHPYCIGAAQHCPPCPSLQCLVTPPPPPPPSKPQPRSPHPHPLDTNPLSCRPCPGHTRPLLLTQVHPLL